MARPQPAKPRQVLLYAYVALIIIGGGAILFLNLPRIPLTEWPSAGVFLLLVFIAESAPITL